MLPSSCDIYTSAPMRGLLADEAAACQAVLRRCGGARALLFSASVEDAPPNPPFLGQWVSLHVAAGRIGGDVRGSASEPLPFMDKAFDLVLLRHVLEPAPLALEEAIRVLAPGGTLIVTGLSPWSAWMPWWWGQNTGDARARSPWPLAARLRRARMRVERVQRVGRLLPSRNRRGTPGWHRWGGAYVLVANKGAPNMTPTRLRPAPVTAPVQAGLASGVRRHSVG